MSKTGEFVPGIGTTKNFKAAADGRQQLHSTSATTASIATKDRFMAMKVNPMRGSSGRSLKIAYSLRSDCLSEIA
jgi:hypothetical protein